ncbi:MAG TPA: PAS domain S-box protein [Longimicrobium sp.]|nr:PAS domain S-box protein [Longimicrobium sp.]
MSDAPDTPPPSPAAPAAPFRAEALLQAASAGIVGVAPDGTIAFADAEAARLLGRAADDVRGLPLAELIAPPPGQDAQPAFGMTLRDGAARQSAGIVTRGGAALAVEYAAAAIVEGGRITGAAVTLRDAAPVDRRADTAANDRERLEERLNERTRRILESITDAFFALDHQWRFTWLNDEAEQLLARTREELMGRGIWDEFPAAVGTLFQQEYERAAREQLPVQFEAYYPPPLDAWYEVRAYPSDDGLSVYFQTINERVATQRALQESEERYRSLIEASSAIVWSTPASGEFGGEQPGWSAFTGQGPQVYGGLGWMACVHPDDRAHTAESWTRALDTRGLYETQHRLRRADGEYRDMEVRAVPVLHADGSLREWVGVHTDVTDEKRVEAALRRSEESYRFLADTIPQLVWTTLADGYHEYYNRRWYEYTGLSYEQTRGTGWNDVLHPDDKERAWERWRHSLDTGDRYSIEYRFKGGDGRYRWFLGQALPFRDDDGQIVRWFGTCTDIHDHKRAEEERERLIRDLEASNRALDQFAYVASHDLKAPLRGIANLSEWMEEDLGARLDGDARKHMDLLRGRVHRMEGLIHGILQYSRAGRVREAAEPVDTGALLAEVVDLLAPPAGIEIRVMEGMPTVLAERLPLQQVFMNLVGNAVKYGAAEHPRITVRADAGKADGWVFAVSDNGPGIAPAYHDRIFGIFQTLQARDAVEGTGIGLSLVRKIVESRGGRVWVESAEGAGATFRFHWPHAQGGA